MDLIEGAVFMLLKVDLNLAMSYCTLVHSPEGRLVQQTLISDSVLKAKEEKKRRWHSQQNHKVLISEEQCKSLLKTSF